MKSPIHRIAAARRPLAAALALVLAGGASLAHAGGLPVTSCADDGSAGTLRQVIAGAGNGDTVDLTTLACSTITLAGGAIPVNVASLTIDGGSAGITISGADADRVLYHAGGGTLGLIGITIAHGRYEGYSGRGGCVFSYGYVQLEGSTVTACSVHATGYDGYARGGGIYAAYGVTLSSSTVSGNTTTADGTGLFAIAHGGGVYTYAAHLTTQSNISGNTASSMSKTCGGGLYATTAVLQDSGVSDNTASVAGDSASQATGGGICGRHATLFTSEVRGNTASASAGVYTAGGGIRSINEVGLHSSTVSGNRALSGSQAFGGGISAFGTTSVTYSTIDHNASSGSAGGVSGYTMFVNGSTVSANRAENGVGGGVYGAPLSLKSSTVAFNFASAGGGGAFAFGTASPQYLYSAIIADNTVGANATHAADFGSIDPAVLTGANNLVIDADAAITLPGDTLHADPQLLPLADYGGPTRTHALRQTSPAIDAGNNNGNFQDDQRGSGYARSVGAAPDIGAFEVQGPLDGDVIFRNGFDG